MSIKNHSNRIQFNLAQLLIGAALVPIVIALLQAEGCGKRVTFVESISFSADGERFAVAKLAARRVRAADSLDKTDLSRTISIVASRDRTARVIHQDFLRGNHGTGIRYWWSGRTSSFLHPNEAAVTYCEFGGGDLYRIQLDRKSPVKLTNGKGIMNLVNSNHGEVYVSMESSVFDMRNISDGSKICSIASPKPALGLNSFAEGFSVDGGMFVHGDGSHIQVRQASTGFVVTEFDCPVSGKLRDVDFIANDKLLLCTSRTAILCDSKGTYLDTLSESESIYSANVSNDGQVVAIAQYDRPVHTLKVINLQSRNEIEIRRESLANAVAFTPDGKLILHGGADGIVTASNIHSGELAWKIRPPSRQGFAWPIPIAALGVWLYAVFFTSRSRRKAKTELK